MVPDCGCQVVKQIKENSMEHIRATKSKRGLVYTLLSLIPFLLMTGRSLGQTDRPTVHTVFMTGVEVKGGTTTDKLAPPSVDPQDLSKGYGFKPPGMDKANAKRWEVSSYIFSPSFVTVLQGDTVKLTTFMVNGDQHEVWIADPNGKRVVAATKWNRGREYAVEFIAEKTGTYQLICSEHAPSMLATFLVLPRK
jgi:plastocyanin